MPGVPPIVDWSHAVDYLWAVADAVHGEPSPAAQTWAEQHLDYPWNDQVAQVVTALEGLDLTQAAWPAIVQEAPAYFRSNQDRMRGMVHE